MLGRRLLNSYTACKDGCVGGCGKRRSGGRFGEVSEQVPEVKGVVGDVHGGVRGKEVLMDGIDERAKAVSGRGSRSR